MNTKDIEELQELAKEMRYQAYLAKDIACAIEYNVFMEKIELNGKLERQIAHAQASAAALVQELDKIMHDFGIPPWK